MAKAPKKIQRQEMVLLGFFHRFRGEDGQPKYRPIWWKVGVLAACMLIIGTLALGTFRYVQFKYVIKYPDTKLSSMLLHDILPGQKEKNMHELGLFFLDKCRELFEEGEFGQGFFYLKQGVMNAPEDLESRMQLSQIYLSLKNKDYALFALEGGLPYAGEDDIEFLIYYCKTLLFLKEDKRLLDYVKQELPEIPVISKKNIVLAMAAAQSNHLRGKFDTAENFISDYDLLNSPDGALLSSQISWDRGHKETAIAKLKDAVYRFPDTQRLYLQIIRFLRASGDHSQAMKYAVMRMTQNPLDPAPRVEIIQNLMTDGREDRVKEEVETFLRQFKDNEAALGLLGNFAVEYGMVDLARRLYELSLEKEYELATFSLMFVEANIMAERYEEAIKFTEQLEGENPGWMDLTKRLFNSLQSIAYYGMGNQELGELYMNKFLQAEDVRSDWLLLVARRFKKLGLDDEARLVLLHAYNTDTGNQAALTKLVEADLDLGNSQELPAYLRKLLQMRRPSYDLIERAYRELGSDRFIFTKYRESLLAELNGYLNEPEQG